MPEIIRNKRKSTLMPGIDTVTGDIKAYRLQNTLIAGTLEECDDILNSLLCHLVMFNNPDDLSVEYYSYCRGLDIWSASNNELPHFRNQIYADNISKVWERLEQMLQFSLSTFPKCDSDFLAHANTVIVLNELDQLLGSSYHLRKERVELLKALIACGDSIGLKVIIAISQDDGLYEELLSLFTLRLTKQLHTDWISNMFGYKVPKDDCDGKHVWTLCNYKQLTIQKFKLNSYTSMFLKNLKLVYGMRYSSDVWGDIVSYKPLSGLTHSHLYLLIKRVAKHSFDASALSTSNLKRIYLQLCYQKDTTMFLGDLLDKIINDVSKEKEDGTIK